MAGIVQGWLEFNEQGFSPAVNFMWLLMMTVAFEGVG